VRTPRPTPLITHAEAAEVVRAALDHSFGARDQQLVEKIFNAEWTETGAIAVAKRGNFRPLTNLLAYRHQALGPQGRALMVARLRGEFKGKRGQPQRKLSERSFNYALALELPFIQEVLRVHYPHVPATKTWAIEIAARVFHLDELAEEKFRKFLTGPHRPRRRLP
jgi:hypothetical protein